jgi:hypothetical protein
MAAKRQLCLASSSMSILINHNRACEICMNMDHQNAYKSFMTHFYFLKIINMATIRNFGIVFLKFKAVRICAKIYGALKKLLNCRNIKTHRIDL